MPFTEGIVRLDEIGVWGGIMNAIFKTALKMANHDYIENITVVTSSNIIEIIC